MFLAAPTVPGCGISIGFVATSQYCHMAFRVLGGFVLLQVLPLRQDVSETLAKS